MNLAAPVVAPGREAVMEMCGDPGVELVRALWYCI